MPLLKVFPHGGINTRFPEHKIIPANSEKPQKVREYRNMISIDGKLYIVQGASKYDSTAKQGTCTWAKRIYYDDGGDRKRVQFAIIGGKMYRGNDNDNTLNQVPISGSYEITISQSFFPIDATMKVAGVVTTFLCDGAYFYKFNGNNAGAWERLPILTDLDGNNINPIFMFQWLDRLWVLTKDKNVLLGSNNLNPEVYNDANDSVLLETPPGNGGYPVALTVMRGFLILLHEDYMIPVSGSSPSTFGLPPGNIIEGYGTRAPRSVVNLKTSFAFLNSEDNEYYLSGGTIDSTEKIPLSYEIKLKELIDPVLASQSVAIHDPNLDALRISYVPSGGSVLSAEEIYSLAEKKWCGQTRERYISCYSLWNGKGDNSEVITGRSDIGAIMKEDANLLTFDGSAIHYRLVTGSYLVSDIQDAQFDEFFIDGNPLGNYGVPLSYYLDGRITTGSTESINNQGEIINLGLIEIKDQNFFLNRALPFIDKSKGRAIRFQIEETQATRKLELYGIYASYTGQSTKQSKYLAGTA